MFIVGKRTDYFKKHDFKEVTGVIITKTDVTAPAVGQFAWNQAERTVDLGVNGVTLQLGQEQLINVRNSSGAAISNGKVVMMTGTVGVSGRITVGLFDGSDAKKILGVATEDIANGSDGFVTTFGKVRGINTSSWAEGAVLYTTSSGGLTSTAPVTGVKMPIAVVINSHATAGTLFVRINPLDLAAYEPANTNIQSHIASTSNPHVVTKAQVGLGNVDNTSDANKPVSTATTTLLNSVNLTRADKYLAAQNVANMVYTNSNLTKIQYKNATDVDYEVLTYTSGNLTGIAHYVGGALKGNTVLTYSSGSLVSAIFTGV